MGEFGFKWMWHLAHNHGLLSQEHLVKTSCFPASEQYSNPVQESLYLLRTSNVLHLGRPLYSIIVNLTCLLDFCALVYPLEINHPEAHKRIKWVDAFLHCEGG